MIKIKLNVGDSLGELRWDSTSNGVKFIRVDEIGLVKEICVEEHALGGCVTDRGQMIWPDYFDRGYGLFEDLLKITGVYMVTMKDFEVIGDLYPKTKDAILVLKHFGKELENKITLLYAKKDPSILLDEATRLESESLKK